MLNFIKNYAGKLQEKLQAEITTEQALAKKAEAETVEYLRRAETEHALAKKTEAETVECLRRAATEQALAKKTEAETVECLRRAVTERSKYNFMKGGRGLLLCALVLLVGDYIYHESETFIMWKMKKSIRRGASVPPRFEELAFVREDDMKIPPLGFSPLMLFGPSGSGKTTELREFANDLKNKKVPVVFISLREYRDEVGSVGVVKSSSMDEVSKSVCQQIDHPSRRFILYHLYSDQIVSLAVFFGSVSSYLTIPSSEVLGRAFIRLFQCCDEITCEMRGGNINKSDDAAVIIIDELHDFIKDSRLASFVRYSVHSQRVKFVLAARSYEFITDYSRRDCFHRIMFATFELPDLKPEIVKEGLVKKGYTPDEAQSILDLAGTRLRLIDEPLRYGININVWKAKMNAASESAFSGAFQKVTPDERLILVKILNNICDEGSVRNRGTVESFMRSYDFAPILHFNGTAGVTFQTDAHRHFWAKNRKSFMNDFQKFNV